MRVLFATSEAHPLIKTGGLADVSGALPKALTQIASGDNVDIKIIIPGYKTVLAKVHHAEAIATIGVFGYTCKIILGKMPDSSLDVIVIQNAALYERTGGPYSDENGIDWPDNPLRFGVLSRIASMICSKNNPIKNWQPDLIQCNDWQTGLAPAYIKLVDKSTTKSILSIHNLAFQGCFDASWVVKLDLPKNSFQMNGFEYYGQLSFLKAGIFYADQLCTVSPTYAEEIQTDAFGFGMQGLLKSRSHELTGILNGIDEEDWNPSTDKNLIKNYNNIRITGKSVVKRNLQEKLGLQIDANAPLLGIVSRLTYQKGLDLLPEIMPKLIEQGCQFAILGSGDKVLETNFKILAAHHPKQVAMNTGYNEQLSHSIMAGSDIFIMPSRFEPCGLNQLYGLAYGTPPVVSHTGGLADSVCDTNELTIKDNTATGFVVKNVNHWTLLVTIERAINYWKDKKTWRQIQSNGMKRSIGWDSSAKAYLALYEKTLSED